MRLRGAKVSDEDFPIILDYLSTHFLGEALQPLNLNTASQIDLEAAGGLLRREAAAVIQYRDKHGRFKTIDDLRKVPGLDFKKIESRRDAMVVIDLAPAQRERDE
jgi:competence protein ComEA